MIYYEYLCARRALLIYTAIAAALAFTVYAVTAYHSHDAVIRIELGRHHFHGLPVVFFTSVAAWTTAILACTLATSLNRQREHLAYTWTRPQDRAVMGISLVALDLAALLCAFVIVVAIEIACYEGVTRGQFPVIWDGPFGDVLRALGFAVMWFSIVQALSARLPVRSSVIAGMSWPVFIVGAMLEAARFPSPWNEILTAINLFNPMAYLSGTSVTSSGAVVLQSFIGFAPAVRLALMYGISACALIVAVTTWKRMEA